MILQALYEYQNRLDKKTGKTLPPGCDEDELKFLIDIAENGDFIQISDLREGKKGKKYPLPIIETRTGTNAYQKPSLMWDWTDFVLGRGKKDKETPKKFEYFKKRVRSTLAALEQTSQSKDRDDAIQALRSVLAFYNKGQTEAVFSSPLWKDCQGQKITFRLEGSKLPAASLPAILSLAAKKQDSTEPSEGQICLVTGRKASPARLHPKFKIRDGQSTGAGLVSFQMDSGYDSYYKKQGFNAPVSEEAAEKYGKALTRLLNSPDNSFYMSGDTYVFWALPPEEAAKVQARGPAQELNSFEQRLKSVIVGMPQQEKDDPDKGVEKMRALFESIYRGEPDTDDDGAFYLLGLSPNVARISVSFWKKGTVREFRQNLQKHLKDLDIQNSDHEHLHYTLRQLLQSVTLDGNPDKLPRNIFGALLDSVVSGTPYPMTFYQRVLERTRVESRVRNERTQVESRVRNERTQAESRVRNEWAAVIKGTLNRWIEHNMYNTGKEPYNMSLDTSRTDPAYLCGRLFAVIEKIQKDAMPAIESPLSVRYYAAASTIPAYIFPKLLRMEKFYLKDMKYRTIYEKLQNEIADKLTDFPTRLNIVEQGAFALGYHHQNSALYTKKESQETQE